MTALPGRMEPDSNQQEGPSGFAEVQTSDSNHYDPPRWRWIKNLWSWRCLSTGKGILKKDCLFQSELESKDCRCLENGQTKRR